ncbi:MAG: CbtB-domain containing protein [Rhodospirillaceae bacterium]|jgi:cobalt transporter subunit CbtB|nr:CbtB-domain containing protein [Rhodospirillaceae bacterium]MBT4220636.1 CbtB-domain containing protein [Rhodospirillaceae bacterium]MBT4464603.1 CbtB-domain containing protein [Rhodospirillaceae bacterium]MBT5013197.1 CbtB-domain containing protein [Rhodospirillaceae bacterium]MBT5308737.1 CbtB-domain containing protein [Rhodospirillaceae bacterium]
MKTNTSAKAVSENAIDSERSSVVLSALFAVMFGAFFVYGAGFANSSNLHDTAHDTRHAFAFPCH